MTRNVRNPVQEFTIAVTASLAAEGSGTPGLVTFISKESTDSLTDYMLLAKIIALAVNIQYR
jgi:hypothetical protein